MLLESLTGIATATTAGAVAGPKVAQDPQGAAPVGKLAQQQPTPQDLEAAVRAAARQIESYLKSIDRAIEFRVDADTGRTVVTVRDTASGDVIRQIPGDEVLQLARHLDGRANALVDIAV